MWTAWLLLTLNGLFFTLRLAGNTGSFPKALTREEEQNCLDRMAKGDANARDTLIEHNLRLVAHIVKKEYSGRRNFPAQKRPPRGRRISNKYQVNFSLHISPKCEIDILKNVSCYWHLVN